MPERKLSRLPRRWRDKHLVGGDVLDPPRARAEHEDVAHPGLIDHLLVELADPARMPPALVRSSGQEHSEQPAVRNRAAVGDRDPLTPRPAAQNARRAVPYQPWPEARELLAWVTAGEHVKHG